MKLFEMIKTFHAEEDGAVTVDWVVLTAAVVGLGIAVVTTVAGGLNTAASSITTDLNNAMTAATTASDGPS